MAKKQRRTVLFPIYHLPVCRRFCIKTVTESAFDFMRSSVLILRSLVAVLLLGFLAAGCRRAPESAFDGYYCGRTADGRSVWFSLNFENTNFYYSCILHVAGTAGFLGRDEFTVTNQTNVSMVFETERDSAPEGPYITGLHGDLSGKPPVLSGMLTTSNKPKGIALLATNVARFKHLKGYHGLEFRGRGGGARYEAMFPEFSGTNQLQSALNKFLIANARDDIHGFVTNGYDNAWTAWKERNSIFYKWEGTSDVQISFLSERLMSLYEDCWAETGGAHGNTTLVGHNLLCVNGKWREFTLEYLFRPGSEWEKLLSSACVRGLRRQEASDFTLGRTKEFKAADISVFTLDEDGLAIHFDPYAVGSYAEGSFHVFVPWSEVRPLLDTNGPAKFISGALSP